MLPGQLLGGGGGLAQVRVERGRQIKGTGRQPAQRMIGGIALEPGRSLCVPAFPA
jgi:hypothetical protein